MERENQTDVSALYRRLQQYIGWTAEDARRVKEAFSLVEPAFTELVDDFYETIEKEPQAAKVITGGHSQVDRLKVTLTRWLIELFSGEYDEQYVARRWRVGHRHVEIGLSQVYTNVALSRLRTGLHRVLTANWIGTPEQLTRTIASLNQLLDLDLALIEDAYNTEFLRRQQRTERLATIGQVAGGVAHELRNPLNVVKTSVYYLMNARSLSPDKIREHLTRIERQVGMADDVITALNDFAKLPIPDVQPVRLVDCVNVALDELASDRGIEIVRELPDNLPPIAADERQLRIVFGNLIRNARDAMLGNGRLTVRARLQERRLVVEISDTGTGIAPEHLPRITEPLFSTKARGIGLGLAVTRAILDKHQAELHVTSEVGKGSTFSVVLPTVSSEVLS